jgi:hypothetical protein
LSLTRVAGTPFPQNHKNQIVVWIIGNGPVLRNQDFSILSRWRIYPEKAPDVFFWKKEVNTQAFRIVCRTS